MQDTDSTITPPASRWTLEEVNNYVCENGSECHVRRAEDERGVRFEVVYSPKLDHPEAEGEVVATYHVTKHGCRTERATLETVASHWATLPAWHLREALTQLKKHDPSETQTIALWSLGALLPVFRESLILEEFGLIETAPGCFGCREGWVEEQTAKNATEAA